MRPTPTSTRVDPSTSAKMANIGLEYTFKTLAMITPVASRM